MRELVIKRYGAEANASRWMGKQLTHGHLPGYDFKHLQAYCRFVQCTHSEFRGLYKNPNYAWAQSKESNTSNWGDLGENFYFRDDPLGRMPPP
jgi:hypothetical protein